MERCHVDKEKTRKGGDWGALRGPNIDGGHGAQSALENQGTATFPQEGREPADQIGVNAALPKDAGQGAVVDVVETGVDVQKAGGHLPAGRCSVLLGLRVFGRHHMCSAPGGSRIGWDELRASIGQRGDDVLQLFFQGSLRPCGGAR